MDQIFAKASNQAVSFAIKSGISLASGYAIKTISKMVEKLPESEKNKIKLMKNSLQIKINILMILIDLIKLASARGNTTLENTLLLIDELETQFHEFDSKIELLLKKIDDSTIKLVEAQIKLLLSSMNESIPLINLSLTTSGVNLNGQLQKNISPGRLIQAASHLPSPPQFDLVLYTIFYNPAKDGLAAITWKESFARATISIVSKKFDSTLIITENFNDGRYHDEEEEKPGVKKIPLDSLNSMFFSASGKLLKLESRNSPVLVIKTNDDTWIALGEQNIDEFDEEEPKTSTSLSLLEYILRLAKIQQIEQKSILDVKDEILSLYLTDESTNSELAPSLSIKRKELERKKKVDTDVGLDSNVRRLENLKLTK